jgi:lysophospholipase L1-like esterase
MSGRRPPTETRPPAPELERLVRYCHPAKLLATTRLPGLGTLDEAALYGVPAEHYREIAAAIRREAIEAARALRRDDEVRRLLTCVRRADRVLALGDSHTDDLASWAEILAALAGVPVVNAGLSGDTTTAALARLHGLPPADHAIVMLGTNDARRHGEQDVLVSDRETLRNLRAIGQALYRRCRRVTWITPPPVDEDRIRRAPALAAASVSWRCAEVAAKADIVRRAWPDAIDLWPGFGPEHLASDGLHPSSAGQRLIAERVLRRLVRASDDQTVAWTFSGE